MRSLRSLPVHCTGIFVIGFGPLWLTGESRKVNWQNSAPALVYPRWARKLHPPTILAGTPSSRTCGSAQQPRPLRCTPPIEAIANYCSIPCKQQTTLEVSRQLLQHP